jgi:hypothetical protein
VSVMLIVCRTMHDSLGPLRRVIQGAYGFVLLPTGDLFCKHGHYVYRRKFQELLSEVVGK